VPLVFVKDYTRFEQAAREETYGAPAAIAGDETAPF